jgi:hypothetical protein
MPGGEIIAIEIKRTLSPKVTRGLVESMKTIGADRAVILIPRGEAYPLSDNVMATGLPDYLQPFA